MSAAEAGLVVAVDRLLDHVRARDLSLVLISNEVGMGLVPPYVLGRRYRDVLGRVTAPRRGRADAVVPMVAGLPVDLRRFLVGAPAVPGDTPS